VGRLTDTPRSDGEPQTGVVMLSGRYRLPSDVVGELMDHLARSSARIAVCDLTGMAASREMDGMFAPVASYLAAWPGTLVVVCVPEASEHSRMVPAGIADRLLVHRSIESGLREARALTPVMEQTQTLLPPFPAAVSGARDLVSSALRGWQLTGLAWPASLVTSELVANAMKHSATVLNLTVSHVDTRLRIAVHDHGGGEPAIPTRSEREAAAEQNGRGLQLIEAESRAWGVFPGRGRGKTVWALLDVAQASPGASQPMAVTHIPALGSG